LKASFILANPPFNDSDWKGDLLRDDARWKYGVPPTGNANFAWVQEFIYHLSRWLHENFNAYKGKHQLCEFLDVSTS
jgi:type I restriction enzyme M protein